MTGLSEHDYPNALVLLGGHGLLWAWYYEMYLALYSPWTADAWFYDGVYLATDDDDGGGGGGAAAAEPDPDPEPAAAVPEPAAEPE